MFDNSWLIIPAIVLLFGMVVAITSLDDIFVATKWYKYKKGGVIPQQTFQKEIRKVLKVEMGAIGGIFFWAVWMLMTEEKWPAILIFIIFLLGCEFWFWWQLRKKKRRTPKILMAVPLLIVLGVQVLTFFFLSGQWMGWIGGVVDGILLVIMFVTLGNTFWEWRNGHPPVHDFCDTGW